ncbi:MAG: hypothetical protein JXB10_15110 [Pirellulales bacterium]|nr:hypothetical protein [Pirellulales bacterium]
MLSSLTTTLTLLALLTTGEQAAPASAEKTPPVATQKASAAEKKSPAAAKADSPKKDSAAKDKKESDKKKSAAKKDLDLHPIEVSVISLTNQQRKKYGLSELKVDKELMRTARKHCGWMTRNRIFQHGNWGVAENIAMGQRDSGQVVGAWMNSSGHRANILNPRHRRIGVSAYRTKSGTIYWCQQFRN